MWSRRIESICGLLGGVLGVTALAVALFAPTDLLCASAAIAFARGGCVGVSLVHQTGLAGQALPIALFGGASLGIIVFTLWQVRAHSVPALVLLWACTALLMVATLLSLRSTSSPSVLFIPAAVLALVASISGTLRVR